MGPEPELPEPGFGAQALAQEVLGHQSCKVISKDHCGPLTILCQAMVCMSPTLTHGSPDSRLGKGLKTGLTIGEL